MTMAKFISQDTYLQSKVECDSLQEMMSIFRKNLKPDGVRNRAYLKLCWQRKNNKCQISQNQNYFQSAESNYADGGKVRNFATMDFRILELPVMKKLLQKNTTLIKNFDALKNHEELTLGLHFIQYKADPEHASYSSPAWLHRDDEPLVFVHLLHLSDNALGGDNLIANLKSKEVEKVIRLEKPMETLLLTRDYLHAVTPLGSRAGVATRDILLFTVEPAATQINHKDNSKELAS